MRRVRPEEVAAMRNDGRLLAAIAYRKQNPGRYRMSEAYWLVQGNCANVDPEFMFPAPRAKAEAQLAMCDGCPVQTPCLVRALESGDRFGVWGGTRPSERRVMQLAWNEEWDRDAEESSESMNDFTVPPVRREPNVFVEAAQLVGAAA